MANRFKKNKKRFDAFIKYSSLAFEMMAMIVISTFLGYKIDQWMDNDFRWFTLSLMVIGAVGSVYYFIRKLLK